MSTTIKVRKTSERLCRAYDKLPKKYSHIVTIEKSCLIPTLYVDIMPFTSEEEARAAFDAFDISQRKGFMKHYMTRERFAEYVMRVTEVRVMHYLDLIPVKE